MIYSHMTILLTECAVTARGCSIGYSSALTLSDQVRLQSLWSVIFAKNCHKLPILSLTKLPSSYKVTVMFILAFDSISARLFSNRI